MPDMLACNDTKIRKNYLNLSTYKPFKLMVLKFGRSL